MKVIIVGGVAGGASCAARLRRLDESAQITVFEKSGFVSYANCGLPYYVGGTIAEKSALTLQTPASFRARFNVDVRVRHEVVAIDRARKVVTVRDLENGREFAESYDKLVLSPGARPVVPPLPGIDGKNIFTLRTVEDALRIREFVDATHPASATVVGGGFIGLEMAENLAERGAKVTIVEKMEQLLSPLDADMAAFVHAKFRAEGLSLRLGCAVTGFAEKDGQVVTNVDVGPAIAAEMVILAIGVSPDSGLAKAAGLALGARGSILVDKHMRTSDAGHIRRGRRGAVGKRRDGAGSADRPRGAGQQAGPRWRRTTSPVWTAFTAPPGQLRGQAL